MAEQHGGVIEVDEIEPDRPGMKQKAGEGQQETSRPHAAVEFEDPRASITSLRDAGIAIAKLQLSSALRIATVEPQIVDQLRPFDEPVYLHQVVEARDGRVLRRYLDLPEALGNVESAAGAEWRIHFHVPIFIEELRDFSTTQAFLREVLALHRREPVSDLGRLVSVH